VSKQFMAHIHALVHSFCPVRERVFSSQDVLQTNTTFDRLLRIVGPGSKTTLILGKIRIRVGS